MGFQMPQTMVTLIMIIVFSVFVTMVSGNPSFMFVLTSANQHFLPFLQQIYNVGECEWNSLVKMQNSTRSLQPFRKVGMVETIHNLGVSHFLFL